MLNVPIFAVGSFILRQWLLFEAYVNTVTETPDW